MICFQISIFEPLGTIVFLGMQASNTLWFAFKLVSLNHWEQLNLFLSHRLFVVICFQISIFEPLGTMEFWRKTRCLLLWFAFKLVSLNHWEQLLNAGRFDNAVVICFQISIFEPLGTMRYGMYLRVCWLWFAFKLVSLNHWEQLGSGA